MNQHCKMIFQTMFFCLLFGGLLFSIQQAFSNYLELGERTKAYRTVLLERDLSQADYEFLKKEEEKQEIPTPFVLWEETANESVSLEEPSQMASASLLKVRGEMSLLFQGNTYMEENDQEGCLISDALARELFGSDQVLGLSLFYQGQPYAIRAVVPENTPFFLLNASAGKEELFSHLSFPKNQDPFQFLVRHSLTGKELEFSLLQDLSQIFLLFLPAVVSLFLLAFFLQKGISSGFKGICLWWGMGAVLLIVFYLFCQSFCYFPENMIPDRWSDFSFWPSFWETTRKKMLFLIQASKSIQETACVLTFFRCIGYSVLSWILSFWLWRLFMKSAPVSSISSSIR